MEAGNGGLVGGMLPWRIKTTQLSQKKQKIKELTDGCGVLQGSSRNPTALARARGCPRPKQLRALHHHLLHQHPAWAGRAQRTLLGPQLATLLLLTQNRNPTLTWSTQTNRTEPGRRSLLRTSRVYLLKKQSTNVIPVLLWGTSSYRDIFMSLRTT